MKINKTITSLKSNLKKRNYKAFFFILGFTITIWSFVKLSNTYTSDVELTLHLKDIPSQLIFQKKTETLQVQVSQTGFKILLINWFYSSIDFNLNELDSLSNQYAIDFSSQKSKISKALKVSPTDLEISQDSLKFEFYKLTSKKLRVQPDFQVTFAKGYDSIGTFSFEPNSVEVYGKDLVLDSVDFISTVKKQFKNVSDTLKGKVALKILSGLDNADQTKAVNFSLPVVKFTEGNVEIPITVNHGLENKEFIIFPKTVRANFKTSLANYNKIDPSDFEVVAEYEPDKDFMYLQLGKKPKWVKNVSLENTKINYLIKQ